MPRLFILILASLLFRNTGLAAPAPVPTPAPVEKYDPWKVWLPPISSLYLGFGSGQAFQDRFRDTGWMYAVADGIGVGLIFLSYGDCSQPAGSCQSNKDRNVNAAKAILIVSRVAQIVDTSLWSYRYSQSFQATASILPAKDGALFVADVSF